MFFTIFWVIQKIWSKNLGDFFVRYKSVFKLPNAPGVAPLWKVWKLKNVEISILQKFKTKAACIPGKSCSRIGLGLSEVAKSRPAPSKHAQMFTSGLPKSAPLRYNSHSGLSSPLNLRMIGWGWRLWRARQIARRDNSRSLCAHCSTHQGSSVS